MTKVKTDRHGTYLDVENNYELEVNDVLKSAKLQYKLAVCELQRLIDSGRADAILTESNVRLIKESIGKVFKVRCILNQGDDSYPGKVL